MAEGQDGGFLREVQDLADKFKEDDEQYISPYAHLEKAAVLQEARYVVEGKPRWNRMDCPTNTTTACNFGQLFSYLVILLSFLFVDHCFLLRIGITLLYNNFRIRKQNATEIGLAPHHNESQ